MPFAYLAVDFVSIDGKEHAVEIYTDLSAGIYNPYCASSRRQ